MSDVLADAQKLYRESLDCLRDQRRQIEEDARFSDPSDPQQWDEQVRLARENDPGGKRPCLVFDQTTQYCANVAGQVEKQPPALHAIPVGGGADKKAAEQIDGRFRHVEYASRAMQHYQRVLWSAARLGVGYLVVRPEYTNRALNWQEPRISSEPDPLKVVFDPWSTETDGSDAKSAFLLSALSKAEFKRRFPGKEPCSFGDMETTRHDDRESVIVAEQWYIEDGRRNYVVVTTENGEEALAEDDFWSRRQAGVLLVATRNYVEKVRTVKWRQMSGEAVLAEADYPADSIGVVPVYGYVGWRDGRMTYCGIPRRARHAQQAYNYHRSEEQAYIGTAPRSPWLIPHAALVGAGVKEIWDQANTQTRAYLPYEHRDEEGNPIPPPSRVNPAANVVNHQAGAEQALRDIQASIGMYQASLGAPSNETSGVAIEGRKQQGEASTAHFPSHLAASLGQVGKIVLQMDARLTDTRRKVALVGVDGSSGSVQMDPEQTDAFAREKTGEVSVNPRVGEYGVRVVIGASYSTQRSQTNAAFAEIMRGNKEMVPAIAPFWAQTLDLPGSEKLQQALTAIAPAPVKAILQPEGQDKEGPSAAELQAQMQQMQQHIQEAAGIAQEAEKDLADALHEASQLKAALADKQASIEIDEYKAETERLKVTGANEQQIQAIVQQLVMEMLETEAKLPGDPEPGQTPESVPPVAEPMQEPAPAVDQQAPAMQPEAMPEPAEPAEPAQPDTASQLLQGQEQLTQAIVQLAQLVQSPRKRIPVRDSAGNITEVIDRIAE